MIFSSSVSKETRDSARVNMGSDELQKGKALAVPDEAHGRLGRLEAESEARRRRKRERRD